MEFFLKYCCFRTNVDNSEFYPDNKIGFHGESSSVPTENIVPTNCITGKFETHSGGKL